MQQLATDPGFVQEQYSDAEKLRIRIETHTRYSQGETERILDDGVEALQLSPGLRVLDVGCGAAGWHARIAATRATIVGIDLMAGMLQEARRTDATLAPTPLLAQADAMRRIYELHADAAREVGYESLPITPGHFTMDDLALVQQAFPVVERHILEGALVFQTPEPALRFYATNRIDAIRDRPLDASHRARLLLPMRERIEAIIDRDGAFVVPKSVGFFVGHA